MENIKFKNHELEFVEIVSDASIASREVADGKNIPLIILNTVNRKDINILVSNHRYYGQGEVKIQWGSFTKNKKEICLHMSFQSPSEINILVNFNICTQGALVHMILTSKLLYLQGGKEGDKYGNSMGADRIIIEVPHVGFEVIWMKMWHKQLSKHYRKSRKISARKAKKLASEFIKKIIGFSDLRFSK